MDLKNRRARRDKRTRGRGIRLRGRDIDMLHALAKMRLLRTSALARLFFAAKATCQKRLRKLFDAGLIRTVVTGIAEENRFCLTRLGHALLVETVTPAVVPAYRAPPRAEHRSVQHLDLLNEYRIALALGVGTVALELRSFIPDWELRSRDPQAGLVPDAIFALSPTTLRAQTVLALEVDTGSETPNVVAKKVLRYRERHALGQGTFGVVPQAVLLLLKTERRARSLARQIAALGGDGSPPLVLFGLEQDLLPDGGVSKGLRRAKDVLDDAAAGRLQCSSVGLRELVALAPRSVSFGAAPVGQDFR